MFDGDRTKSEEFMQQFKIYWSLNEDHPMIAMPYFHGMYFLSWIKGSLVNDWKNDQVEDLRTKTTRAQNPVAWTEPALWNKLEVAFTTVFTNTAKVQNAYYKLMNYYQGKDSIDTYSISRRSGTLLKMPAIYLMLPPLLTSSLNI